MSRDGVARPAAGHENVRATAAAVVERLDGPVPNVAIVLGSGASDLAAAVSAPVVVPYQDLPGFPAAGVPGHRGELVAGSLDGVPVLLQSGRFHCYEGHPTDIVVFPVRVFATLGVSTLIVTNAAGGVRRSFVPPTLMLIADHINLMFRSPLTGPVAPGEVRFPDMSDSYDPELARLAIEAARDAGVVLRRGVYAGVLGPSYETPAEIRMLDRLGADAVGMSTVPEVIVARARGLRVLGISAITNPAAGVAAAPLRHSEVLDAGRQVAEDLLAVLRGVLQRMRGGR